MPSRCSIISVRRRGRARSPLTPVERDSIPALAAPPYMLSHTHSVRAAVPRALFGCMLSFPQLPCVAAAACLLTAIPPLATRTRATCPTLCDGGDEDDPASAFFRRQLGSLPDDPERCLLQLRASLRESLEASRRVWVSIEVPTLDGASRGFDPKLLARFALSAAQEIDGAYGAECGPPVVLAHGLATTLALTQEARNTAFPSSGGEAAVVPLGAESSESGGGGDTLGSMADPAALARLTESACPVLIVGPFGEAEHRLARTCREDSDPSRVVLLFNHRPDEASKKKAPLARLAGLARRALPPSPPPLLRPLPAAYDAAFELLPLTLVDSAVLRGEKAPPLPIGLDDDDSGRGRGAFVPKAVLCRRYPAPWVLLADADGAGYVEVRSFDRRPGPAGLIDAVGRHVRERQPVTSGGGGGGGDEGALSTGDGSAASSTDARPPGESGGVTMPDGVKCRTWSQIERAPITDDEIKWYSASCLLRMRDARARAESNPATASAPPRLDTSNDESESAIHLFAAEPKGWISSPVRLAACALLVLDSLAPTDESGSDAASCLRVEQLGVASETDPTWPLSLLEAAERLAGSREQRSVAVRAAPGTAWQMACEQRGYSETGAANAEGDGRLWLVKSL